jgi:hypothetical protein
MHFITISQMMGTDRASEARPGIQEFESILDSGFRWNDG